MKIQNAVKKLMTNQNLEDLVKMDENEKTLNVTDSKDLKKKVNDVEVFGDPDKWQLLCKASSKSQGWMKSTKVLETPYGCLIQVSTQQKNPDGSYALAEAVTFVPDLKRYNI